MFVLAIGIAPADISRCTATADLSAGAVIAGQAPVVGTPSTSMLSLTAKAIPCSGESLLLRTEGA